LTLLWLHHFSFWNYYYLKCASCRGSQKISSTYKCCKKRFLGLTNFFANLYRTMQA